MYAVVRTGNKQYRVEPGQEFLVEKLDVKAGEQCQLDDVLLFADKDNVEVGTPQLKHQVACLCVGHERGKKLRTIKYKRRKNYRRTLGHRQWYTRLRVEQIKGAN